MSPELRHPRHQVSEQGEERPRLLEGNLAQRRHAEFVPGGVARTFIPTREAELKGAFDEWLARIVCFAFSISPQGFLAQMNRATAETAQQAALAEGLAPIQIWVKQLIDHVLITEFAAPDLEFCWRDEREIDAQKAASVAQIYVAHGIKTVNEARSDLGLDPVTGGDVPLVFTGSGPVPLAKVNAGAPLGKYSADQPRDERGRWTSDGGSPVQIAANDDGSRSDAGSILPAAQGERATLPPDPAYRSDLKDLVERIANAKPEDVPALRGEIRARYHDVGDVVGGDALDRALSDAVETGATAADRQAILEGIAYYAKGNPEDVGTIRDAAVTAILHTPRAGAARAATAARDPVAAGPVLKSILEENPADYANARAAVLQSAIPWPTWKKVTMSVGVVEDAQGVRSVVISSSEVGAKGLSYPRPTVRPLIQPEEVIVPSDGHAEINILNYGKANNLKVIAVGAGHAYCRDCGPALDAAGVLATGPRK